MLMKSLARACLGVQLGLPDPIAHVRALGGKIPGARPSMLLGLQAGRRCEVDAINGAIVRLGKEQGVPTPVNDVVVALIRAKESAVTQRRG